MTASSTSGNEYDDINTSFRLSSRRIIPSERVLPCQESIHEKYRYSKVNSHSFLQRVNDPWRKKILSIFYLPWNGHFCSAFTYQNTNFGFSNLAKIEILKRLFRFELLYDVQRKPFHLLLPLLHLDFYQEAPQKTFKVLRFCTISKKVRLELKAIKGNVFSQKIGFCYNQPSESYVGINRLEKY